MVMDEYVLFLSSFQVMASSVQGWVRNEFFILDFVFVFHEFLIVLSKHIEYQDPIGLEKMNQKNITGI